MEGGEVIEASCDHDWLGSGEFQPILMPRYFVVCTKCKEQQARQFGKGRPRCDFLAYYREIGEEPTAFMRERMKDSLDKPAVVDPGWAR